MGARVLEAVPNFSEGRDPELVSALVEAMRAAGADVLDSTMDPDHHRSVVTIVGRPEAVEEAVVAAARIASERIDLRRHSGVHPRVGALDVAPFVPLVGLTLEDARASAIRVGARLAAEVGVPVYYYGAASEPPGRGLAALRRGGFEALVEGWPPDRRPDVLPQPWPHAGAHPTAGVTCVGARQLLLAWNVFLSGLSLRAAVEIAGEIRESGGGFRGLRALAFDLPRRGAIQISMNLEDMRATSPMDVVRAIEERVLARGGRVVETEVVGMIPDELVLEAARDRLKLSEATAERLLSSRVLEHLAQRSDNPWCD